MPKTTNLTSPWTLAVCAALALGPNASADGGTPVIKRAPEPTPKHVVAPESSAPEAVRENALCNEDGTISAHYEFERGYSLEQRFPTSRGTERGIALTLVDPEGRRSDWELSPGFLDDLGRGAAKRLPQYGGSPAEVKAFGRRNIEALAGAVVGSLRDTDRAVLEELAQALQPIGRDAIRRGLEDTTLELMDTKGQAKAGDECYGAIGKTLLSLAGTTSCFMSAPATFGAHGVFCFGLAIGTGGLAVKALTGCGGSSEDGCSCWPVKYCMCCELADGESCVCRCGGVYDEPCCYWEESASPLPAKDRRQVDSGLATHGGIR